MAEVKDKVVTVESLSVLHEYSKETYETKENVKISLNAKFDKPENDIVPIVNGGTNASTVEDARTNLEVYSKIEINNLISSINEQLSHYNKVLCEGDSLSTSILTDGAVTISELADYSIFAITLHSSVARCTILCSKVKGSTGGEYISGFSCLDGSSNIYYFKFKGIVSGTTLTVDSAQISTTPDFSSDVISGTVQKIVGIM